MLALIIGVFLTSPVNSQSNQIINFQGKIVSQSNGTNLLPGSPSCIINGSNNDTCDFRVRIYDAPIGGTLLWTEVHNNVEIGHYNGVFNLPVNSICNSWGVSACSVSGVNWNDGNSKYLQIEFDHTGNGTFVGSEIFERDLITANAYAMFSSYSADSNMLGGRTSNEYVQVRPGATPQNINATDNNSLIFLNEVGIGTPDLMRLQTGGTNMLRVTNSGDAILNGGLILGNYTSNTSGAIRWTGGDFEGYNGSSWLSLTSGGGPSNFLGLTDTPLSYSNPGEYLKINSLNNGLDFGNMLDDIGSSFSSGSVIFSNGTTLSENNSNFFFDNLSSSLGIRTNTPSQALDVNGNIVLDEYLYFNGVTSNFLRYDSVNTRFELSNDLLPSTDNNFVLGDDLLRWQALYTGPQGINLGQNGNNADISFNQADSVLGFDTTGDTIHNFSINSLGYVGIGNPNSANPLSIINTGANAIGCNLPACSTDYTNSMSSLKIMQQYDPTGGNPSDIYNTYESLIEILPGDGTDMSRVRGQRIGLINNNSGFTNILSGTSLSVQNNGNVGSLLGLSTIITNNGAVSSSAALIQFIATNSGSHTGQDTRFILNEYINNSPNIPQFYGINTRIFNNSNVPDGFYGGWLELVNATGASTGNFRAQGLQMRNSGTTANSTGLFIESLQANVTGQVVGIDNILGVMGATLNTSEVSMIRNNISPGLESINISGDLYGINTSISGNVNVGGSTYGIYNSIQPSSSIGTYGLYSTEGTTDVFLNYDGLYSIYTPNVAKFDEGIVVGNSTSAETGQIRWTGSDFEGFDGSSWVSLTASGPSGSSPISRVRNDSDPLTNLSNQLVITGTISSNFSTDDGFGYCGTTQWHTPSFGITFDSTPNVIVSSTQDDYYTDYSNDATEIVRINRVTSKDTNEFTYERSLIIYSNIEFVQCNLNNVDLDWMAIGQYTGADLAENYLTFDLDLEPGDVVAIDEENDIAVRKSNSKYDRKSFGIVSTAPAQVMGGRYGESADNATAGSIIGKVNNKDLIEAGRAQVVPIALEGRVPVKVNLENGPVKRGDYLTASSTPGFAMKATEPGNIIGRALEDFNGESYLSTISTNDLTELGDEYTFEQIAERQSKFEEGQGMIMVLVEKGFADGEGENSLVTRVSNLESGLVNTNTSGGLAIITIFLTFVVLIYFQNRELVKLKED